MKKIVCLLIALMAIWSVSFEGLSAKAATETDMLEWHKSEDGVLEARIIDFVQDDYQNYNLHLQFRIDGMTESDIWVSQYNLTSLFSAYTTIRPEQKNRKLSATCNGTIHAFRNTSGVMYEFEVPVLINSDEEVHVVLPVKNIDLSIVFPDLFVNSDMLNCATIASTIRKLCYFPESFKLIEVGIFPYSFDNENYIGYAFDYSAQNRVGGTTVGRAISVWDNSSGVFDLIVNTDVVVCSLLSEVDLLHVNVVYTLNNFEKQVLFDPETVMSMMP